MTNHKYSSLLTIAIPTWNRAAFLKLNLDQLTSQVAGVEHLVEILVSDNGSTDETAEVVDGFTNSGFQLRYIRNSENVGSDCNIAQCFNEAAGQYVLILGDDDLLVDGGLHWLVNRLLKEPLGVLCMKAYGFDVDFRKEFPGESGDEVLLNDAGKFLVEIGAWVTFISSCVINKQILGKLDAREFCGGNLVQVHLVIRAALAANNSVFFNRYLIACKRNNSGGYDFSRVFVEELGRVLDMYQVLGVSDKTKYAFETKLLLGYYPYYLFRQRLQQVGDLASALAIFEKRFGNRMVYNILLKPILVFPRPLAIIWGAGATFYGRVRTGDLRRGLLFAWHRISRIGGN